LLKHYTKSIVSMTTFSILAAAVVDLGCYAPTIFKRATPEN